MQVEKKVLLAIVVLLWFPFYVVIQQWQVPVSVCACVRACVCVLVPIRMCHTFVYLCIIHVCMHVV